jgi:hypothetical protein
MNKLSRLTGADCSPKYGFAGTTCIRCRISIISSSAKRDLSQLTDAIQPEGRTMSVCVPALILRTIKNPLTRSWTNHVMKKAVLGAHVHSRQAVE